MQSLDNACKPNVSTQVSTQNLPLMTASFFIRTSKNNPTASIWIRITEGRGQQYRFNTGHRLLKASSWNKNTQSVRTVASESYDLINLQLRRLKAHVESKAVSAKSVGVHRRSAFLPNFLRYTYLMNPNSYSLAINRIICLAKFTQH